MYVNEFNKYDSYTVNNKNCKFFVGNVKGLDNLKFNGPRIIIANHSSYMDHFVILYLLKNKIQIKLFIFNQERGL
ncbi:1-acyl-sn-glycerol-3-phosphate acyltransferase [Leuconostoc citreum]